ncbi:ABC transporter ATP-binding protein [bacterium 1XD42-8]|nr:ABC transporter ATP-binding protein [bacterium 1XD42-8]
MNYLIEVQNIVKRYNDKEQVLNGVDVCIYENTFVTIVGPSGSGKSTLMNIMSGLQRPTTGRVYVDGMNITQLNANQLADFRAEKIGNVFQEYNLMHNLTGKENIWMGKTGSEFLELNEIVEILNISKLLDKFPYEMSGGEQQRISIARALIKKPRMLFCDEATGALDEKNSKNVVELLTEIKKKYGMTIVFVTHNLEIAKVSERIITMKNGMIVNDKINKRQIHADEMKWD